MPRLLLFILLLNAAASAQAPDLHARILRLAESRDYAGAMVELRGLSENNSKLFTEKNYDYLLARMCERTGDLQCAAASYASVSRRESEVRPYALWHLAHISASSGNLLGERIYLTWLLAEHPGSLLADAAEHRLARSWYESGNYAMAIGHLTRGEGGTEQADRGEQVLLAKAYLYNNDTAAARNVFASLINSGKNPAQPDDHALEAARGLDLLDVGASRSGKAAGELSDYDHLRRAQVYQFNRDFADARLHYAAIIERHPESGIVPDAIYQIGRGHAQSSDFVEAVKWHERTLEQFPEHPVANDALLQLASAYARLNRYREAVVRYERFIEKFPGDDRLDRAYLNIIDVLRDSGSETEALAWTSKTEDAFRGKTAEALAIFARVRIFISRGNWGSALGDLNKLGTMSDLGGKSVPGGATPDEITFLRGYVLEQMQRYPEAIDAYLSVPDGRDSYYGWRATERLKALAAAPASKPAVEASVAALAQANPRSPDERRRLLQSMLRLTQDSNPRTEMLIELREVYSTIPAYNTLAQFAVSGTKPNISEGAKRGPNAAGEALALLGLYDEAAVEIEAAMAGEKPDDTEYAIATAYLKGGRADRATAFIEKRMKAPADYQIELLPGQYTSVLYPTPYKDELLKSAPPHNVDPRLLLAVMRQESRFRPNVKSNAAARGLMQFISATANRIAADLGRTHFEQDELLYPPTAIAFGAKYVGDLFTLFPEQPEAVTASYNGGEDNVKRWVARSHSNEADRYVPEIAFAQSKDYVHRVMANYRMYTLLYDERLNRK